MGAVINSKLPAIGSILMMFPVLNIIGSILVLKGMNCLAKQHKSNHAYRNALIGTIFGMVSFIVISNVFLVVIFISPFVLLALPIVIVFSFLLLMALFFRQSFNALEACSGIKFRVAGLALIIGAMVPLIWYGILYVLGVVLLMDIFTVATLPTVFLSGLLIVDLAFMFMAGAFFSLKQPQPVCQQ